MIRRGFDRDGQVCLKHAFALRPQVDTARLGPGDDFDDITELSRFLREAEKHGNRPGSRRHRDVGPKNQAARPSGDIDRTARLFGWLIPEEEKLALPSNA